jgi:ferritin-like metal-binding protein YciE
MVTIQPSFANAAEFFNSLLATNRDLATGLRSHLEETQKQVERLQKVFAKLGKEPSGTQCPAIDGIIKEANETAGEIEESGS